MDNLITGRLKEISKIQTSIELDNLSYSTRNCYNFNKYSLPVVLLKKLYSRNLTLEEADLEHSMFVTKFKKNKRGRIPTTKRN